MKFIKLSRKWMDAEDNVYDPATVLEVSDDIADELIKAGKAEIHDGVIKQIEEKDIKAEIALKVKEAVTEALKDVKKDDGTDGKEIKESIKVIKDEPIWKDFTDFVSAVKDASLTGRVDERLYKGAGEGQEEADDTEGGYLVERRIGKEIYQMMYQSSILLPKCSSTEVGPNQNGMKINQVNETARSNTSLFGGIRVYSPDEGATKMPFIQKYAQVDIPLGKYAAVNYMTDEMWQDRVGYVNYMRQNVGPAIAWYVDDDILHGTTNARMIEIENHAATVQVNVAGANPTAAELMNMYTAMAPMAIGGAEWYMSLTQYAAISQLESTAGVRIVQPNYVISPYGTLLGKPINIIEQADVDANDTSIMFLNLKWYLVLTKGKLQEASSIHVRFLEDESCFRWVLRLAGSPKLASTVTLPNGSIVSPFVTRN